MNIDIAITIPNHNGLSDDTNAMIALKNKQEGFYFVSLLALVVG